MNFAAMPKRVVVKSRPLAPTSLRRVLTLRCGHEVTVLPLRPGLVPKEGRCDQCPPKK